MGLESKCGSLFANLVFGLGWVLISDQTALPYSFFICCFLLFQSFGHSILYFFRCYLLESSFGKRKRKIFLEKLSLRCWCKTKAGNIVIEMKIKLIANRVS